MKKVGLLIVFITILLYTRFYNIENTTRFIWDESSDLVRLHQIYTDRKLTLVGPISEDNTKVFGSLAYYLSMPFAIAGEFDPLSPVVGTVVGGIITAVGLLILAVKLNKKIAILAGIIILLWFPLVQSSRAGLWAWHVSYIPMWITLGVLLYLKRTKIGIMLAGFFLGLAIHHHYIAVFAISGFALGATIDLARRKKLFEIFLLYAGLTLAILPFVIFDLRHPPGLFLSKILYSNHVQAQVTLESYWIKMVFLYKQMGNFFQVGAIGILALILLIWDFVRLNKGLIWASGWVAQITGLMFISNDEASVHYLLPAAVFFLVWLMIPRNSVGKYVAVIIMVVMAINSIFNIKQQLTGRSWRTDIPVVRFITDSMRTAINNYGLKNVNMAVLASPDNNVYGRRYRDVLLVNNIRLLTRDEYQYTDNMFVASMASEAGVRADLAYEMHFFRKGQLVNRWSFSESGWNLYLFNRNSR